LRLAVAPFTTWHATEEGLNLICHNLVGVMLQTADKISSKLKNETIVIGDCPLAMKQHVTKQLMHGSV